MDGTGNGRAERSILSARGFCAILMILLAGGLLLGLALWVIRGQEEARVYTKTTAYQAPDAELTLEVRRWRENEPHGASGWDFVLISPEGEERLLERTHALADAAITGVDWYPGGAVVHTHGPGGSLPLTWGPG